MRAQIEAIKKVKNISKDFDSYVLGDTGGEIALHDVKTSRVLSVRMLEQARRRLLLFTYDLDPPVYDQSEFLKATKQLALRSGGAHIRILLQDNDKVIKHGHRLLEIARRLSSSIEIRKPHPDFVNHPENFLLVDDCGYVHRKVFTSPEATADFNSPYRVERLQEFFDGVWESSEPDSDLRRLYL